MSDAASLLEQWQAGDEVARDNLVELLYADLNPIAVSMLRRQWSNPRLQPTELVHEAFLKLFALDQLDWRGRAHFLAMAARVMRQILVDHYRRDSAHKRSHESITLITAHLGTAEQSWEFVMVEDALSALKDISPDDASVVEMKFFSGMTHAEIAEVMSISEATVKRRWRAARAWLETHLRRNMG